MITIETNVGDSHDILEVENAKRVYDLIPELDTYSLVPFANPKNEREIAKTRALVYFRENPEGNVSSLSEELGCSKRSAERIVAELKVEGVLERRGSARSGSWVVLGESEYRLG